MYPVVILIFEQQYYSYHVTCRHAQPRSMIQRYLVLRAVDVTLVTLRLAGDKVCTDVVTAK